MTAKDPLEAAALLKLTFLLQGKNGDPGFRFVYRGVLRELGVSDEAVDAHIAMHGERLKAILVERRVIREPGN